MMRRTQLPLVVTGMLMAAVLVGCGGVDSSTPLGTGNSGSDQPPVVSVPDPWYAPLAEKLYGVTFVDGWAGLHAIPPPVQIKGGWTDSLMADPSGQRLYFAYSRYDFFDFYNSGGAVQTVSGPAEGLSGDTFKIFQADLSDGGWGVSLSPVNSSDPTMVQASPAVNASGDLMVYSEFDPLSGRSSLYWSRRVSGHWTAGQYLAINSASCNDDNAKIVGEIDATVDVYFESNRASVDGSGSSCNSTRALYQARFSNGGFGAVQAVPGIAVSGGDDSQPFITADEKRLYWTGVRSGTYGIFTASRGSTSASFGNIHAVATPTLASPFAGKVALIGEASLVDTAEGQLLYMMCGEALNLHNGDTWNDADFIWLKPCVARLPK